MYINFLLAPDDYTAISSLEISFRGGPIRRREIEKTFDVVITDDGIDEPTEDFHINITASNNINVLTPWIIIRICGGIYNTTVTITFMV